MNEYERILRKAVAELGDSDRASRYVVYERARAAVLKQLRALDPPKTDQEIDEYIAALHAAVQHIETEFAEAASAAAPPPARPAPMPGPPAVEAVDPRGRPMGLAAIGIAAAVIVAAAGAYVFVTREPAPKQAVRVDPPAPKAAPAAKAAPAPAQATPASTATLSADPQHASFVLRRQRVYYRTTHPVGSIVVSRNQRFLYVVQPNQVAIRYAIGVGPGCENLSGLFHVTEKQKGPAAQPATFELPAVYFEPSRAVHRTDEPARIGESTKAGCFQAWDSDIADLFERVQLNDRVIVTN
jgi:lipoprotein-anchoring transpeptidase ErfK/SrfK